jgi:hypothetical protein
MATFNFILKMILLLTFVIIVFLGLLFWYLRDYARAGGLNPVETGVTFYVV